ncbi:MAG: hypothetical protein WEA61_01835 [Anaerolineales bacterium]
MSRGRRLTRVKSKPLHPAAQRSFLDWDAKALLREPAAFPKLTSPELFGNRNPLDVEIGSGSGEYLLWLASQDPQANFLGIEVSRRTAMQAANLAAEGRLANVRILRADFKLLTPLLAAEGWRRAFLHFPDPVHKRKDEKRSLVNQAFLDMMASTLISGGELSIASDKVDFLMQMLELAEGDARFEKAHSERYLEGLEAPVKSRFQRFWERKGVQPLRFVLRRL